MSEYIEIICPICGRSIGRKATIRKPLYRGRRGQVIKSIDYIEFMLDNYDLDKEIVIKRKTGKAGFKDFERLSWKDLNKEKQKQFKELIIKAFQYLLHKKIINKQDLLNIV